MLKYYYEYMEYSKKSINKNEINMYRADNNNQNNNPNNDPARTEALFTAIGSDDIDEVARLLEEGADINAVNEFRETPLHQAAIYGHAYIAGLLLEGGC